MPESRDRLVRAWAAVEPTFDVRRGRLVYQDMLREAAFGPDSRRSYHQLQPIRSRRQGGLVGNENTPPAGAGPALRRLGSPLPVWYPRTPLRDITVVVNAMERRRSGQRIASRQRRSQTSEIPSASTSAISPLPQGLSPSETTPVVCDLHSTTSPLVTATGVSAIESSSPRTPTDAIIAASDNPKVTELEARLEKSIEVIEKAVKENLKRTKLKLNDEKIQQRRTLMSMR